MQRYFIKLSYCGTAYHGWQVQKNTSQTIQHILNEMLTLVLGEPVDVYGCGRTDTGVHAKEFYAHFDCSNKNLVEESSFWIHKFNSITPTDIAFQNIYKVEKTINARFDATSRTYNYLIHQKKDPFLIDKSYFFSSELDLSLMNQACNLLLQHTDFSCFSKSNTQVKTNNCKISTAVWTKKEHNLLFTITADRFLRNMVRAIVGTMLDIGQKKISLDDFTAIITSKNRSNAGFSAPACGLYLTQVVYPNNLFIQ